MYNYRQKKEEKDGLFKVVMAMYYANKSTEEIMRQTGLSKIDTLDMMQKMFYLDLRKRGLA